MTNYFIDNNNDRAVTIPGCFIQQESKDGPESLTWIFEKPIALFILEVSEKKNFEEFLHVRTVKVVSIHHVY